MDQLHHRKLERMYHGAPCNQYYRPRLSISEGVAEVVIPVNPNLHHAAHAVHGAVYFKAMDDAAFFAANSLVDDVFVLTAGMHVEFLRPVTDGELRGVGRVVDRSSRRIVCDAEVYNGERLVGRGLGTFMPSKVALTADVGYA